MANNNIFTGNITPRAPIPADTTGYIHAAETEGAGKVAETKANMGVLKDAVGQTLDAVKGNLESGLESDIKKTLAVYKTSVNYDNAVLQHDLLSSGLVGDVGPADLQKAKDDIAKYKLAMDQGTMSREQALLSIDKSVKDYSNIMPGYASDFRKLGYQLTGIEHLGGYEAFMLLSKQSISEKLRYDQMKFIQDTNQKMMSDFVNDYKRWPVGGLNGPEMQIYRQQAQLKQNATNLKTATEVRDLTVAQSEPLVIDYINTRLADGVMTLNTKLQGIPFAVDPTTGKPRPPEDKAVLRQRILADTNTFFETMKSEVHGFGANQLSNTTREQQLSRISKQQNELVQALQNQDAFDDFKKTMQIRQEKTADIMNQWSIANPHLLILQKSGLPTPDLAKVWIDSQRNPQRKADFIKTYGEIMDAFYRSVATGGQGMRDYYINNMSTLSTDPGQLDRLSQTDPGAYAAGIHMVRDGINSVMKNGWGETPQIQQLQKKSFANWIQGFGNQVDPKKEDLVNEWTKTMSDPRLLERIKELPPDQQLQSADAIMTRTRQILENPDFGFMRKLDNLVQEANNNFRGIKYELIVNPTTKQIELTKTEKRLVGKSQAGQTEEVTSPAGLNLGFGEVQKTLQTINRALNILNNTGTTIPEALPQDMKTRGLPEDYLSKLKAGYFNLSYAQRTGALEAAGGGGRKKSSTGEKAALEKVMKDSNQQEQNINKVEDIVPGMIQSLKDRINDPGFKGLEVGRQRELIQMLDYMLRFQSGMETTPSKKTTN